MKNLAILSCLLGLSTAASWPNGPFTTSGATILDASGNSIKYAGANWPGAADVMIPEGLQYQSVASIVAKLSEAGVNVIRLTYAIELIDQIYENNGVDVPISTAFVEALGKTNGTAIYNKVLAANPSFAANITRLEIFDAIAEECAANEIYVHLDNHISTGEWCCSTDDGNAWWGDVDFSIANWTRGLSYMAEHGKTWTALTSMSLRNEPREPTDNTTLDDDTYNWEYWYKYVKQGAAAINDANPDPLILLSGLDFDTYLTPIVEKTALTPGDGTFSFSDFPADKIVLEIHNYDNSATDCSSLESALLTDGFEAMDESNSAYNHFPVILTEWGFLMDSTTWQEPYTECLAAWAPNNTAGWMIWVLSGSYYIRSGVQDYDETWGLLNHDWSDWRNPTYVNESFIPMVSATKG